MGPGCEMSSAPVRLVVQKRSSTSCAAACQEVRQGPVPRVRALLLLEARAGPSTQLDICSILWLLSFFLLSLRTRRTLQLYELPSFCGPPLSSVAWPKLSLVIYK